MKLCVSILFFAMCYCSCGRGKYVVSSIFRKGDISNIRTMALDSTYQFYLREVYKEKSWQEGNVLKTNVEKSDTANKTRIEVEYLLLSRIYNSAIYISTNPDKHQDYYSRHQFADTLINAHDFATFHFGKIASDGESIAFTSGNGEKVITWDIRPFLTGQFPKKVFIREIAITRKDMVENVILINRALEEPLSFTLQKNFTIIFEKPRKKSDTLKNVSPLCTLADQKIYFNKVKYGFDVFLRFDRKIRDSKDSSIRFDYRRMRYSPFQK